MNISEHNPVALEPLKIEGEWPLGLNGIYLRNGSHSSFPVPNNSIFDGDGLLQCVEIKNGHAVYSNHLVQTAGLKIELAHQRSLFKSIHLSRPQKNTSNTSVFFYGEKIFSLWEWGAPYEIALAPLRTLQEFDFKKKLKYGFSAHPKICEFSGDLHFISHHLKETSQILFGQVNGEMALSYTDVFELEHTSASIHDFALTKDHILFFDHPLVYEGDVIKWRENGSSLIHVIGRGRNKKRWRFEIDSCWTFHIVRCRTEGEKIYLSACRWPKYPNSNDHPRIHEWIIDLNLCNVVEKKLSEIDAEMPCINGEIAENDLRYVFTCPSSLNASRPVNSFHKTDLFSGESFEYRYAADECSGEPCFVPDLKNEAFRQDKGWIINLVSSYPRQRSFLALHRADQDNLEMVARIEIPLYVPPGFHGKWMNT